MRQRWPGNVRSHWPGYVFHITHLDAAAAILNSGRLISRSRALREGIMIYDTAAPDIIANTDDAVQDRVRLYFRPLNPTFFNSEGARSRPERSKLGSHCPVPVAFVFDAKGILGREGTTYTDGNGSSPRAVHGSSAAFLRTLPFDLIYHQGSIPPGQENEVRFRRCAEVMVPEPLPLDGFLRHVSVRSPAEYETLQSLLLETQPKIGQYSPRPIGVNRRSPLFFKRWTFIERVKILEDQVTVQFNPDTESPGPFRADFEFFDMVSGNLIFSQVLPRFFVQAEMSYPLPGEVSGSDFRLRILLDGYTVYQNIFPFSYNHIILAS